MELSQDVTVLIPQHGQVDLTLQCVRGLLRHHPALAQVLVVDDGSPKSELQKFTESINPATILLPLQESQGTTAAWNAGLQLVRTSFVVLLNNDVISSGRWIDRLIAPLRNSESGTRLCGPALRQETTLTQLRSPVFKDMPLLEGWCLAVRTEDLHEMHGFDERFQLYFSDTDLQCQFLKQWPGSLRCVPNLPLRHLGHRSTCRLSNRNQIWRQDRQAFLDKWNSGKEQH